ncbi:two-component sensor histidine kinase [Actinosynnema sp. ALI-1.44]|uniref:sensor histidine kinase n=1 Tax=Actinosynnema sp. ALI-1.44 TaxID=1933779 RepID=UPI00097C3724|nr:sensor histidine kinase [Actinosynnema sp. ALI-1.44]ONI72875.1 two-component sensor histidine kinase [Actinosynnema sp. ALI-1.44]
MRKHPTFGDSLLAFFLALFESLIFVSDRPPQPLWLYLLVDVGMIGPLVLRRRRPMVACYLILLTGYVQLITDALADEPTVLRPANIAVGIALYTMVVYVGRRQASIYAVWITIGTVLWAVWLVKPRINDQWWIAGVSIFVLLAFCWTLGEFVGARRAYQAEVEQRLRLLETERDHQAKIAVAEERARIARELHDVVAHAVSVMVVQADGATYAVHTNPELAERAIKTISSTGREALTELRRLLGVLRAEEGGGDERTPQPGTNSLNDLAERVRLVGLPVRLKLKGELDGLPAGIGLGIYRIVQEALTNTLKHAGAGASAVVRVARVGDNVELDITDDGFGTPHELVSISGGNGLIGMRERANVFGGSLQAGPRPGGGWHVHAVLPIQGT